MIGAWLYSYPIGILYHHDRDRHLRHHREVGLPHDPDWINYTSHDRENPARVLAYLASLLFGRLLFSTVLSFVSRGRPRIALESEGRPDVFKELFSAVFCQALMFGLMAFLSGRWWSYLVLWILPLATFAGFFANFRALIEHVSERDEVAPESRLRDIHVGWLERFLVAPSHFNYHALHHAHPSIPHYYLPRGKQAYIQKHGKYPFEIWPGYTSALFDHFKRLRARA